MRYSGGLEALSGRMGTSKDHEGAGLSPGQQLGQSGNGGRFQQCCQGQLHAKCIPNKL